MMTKAEQMELQRMVGDLLVMEDDLCSDEYAFAEAMSAKTEFVEGEARRIRGIWHKGPSERD